MPETIEDRPRVGIYGMGRIGTGIVRANAESGYPLDIVACADIKDPRVIAHGIKYDSTHGTLLQKVELDEEGVIKLEREGRRMASMRVIAASDPADVLWGNLGADYIFEASGAYNDSGAAGHLEGGAKRVIVTAPTSAFPSIVVGANERDYKPDSDKVVDNASCTTKGLAPLVRFLVEKYGIQMGFIGGSHARTNSQPTLDAAGKKTKATVQGLRDSRSAGENLIPSSTGAAKAIGKLFPGLKGKLDGSVIRVPTPDVSIVTLYAILEQALPGIDPKERIRLLNEGFKAWAANTIPGVFAVNEGALVSTDFLHMYPFDSVLDAPSTNVLGDKFVNVAAWYDNERAPAHAAIRLAKFMADIDRK